MLESLLTWVIFFCTTSLKAELLEGINSKLLDNLSFDGC
jgi:hypothetical protein